MTRKGSKARQVAGALGISRRTICRVRANSKKHGDIEGEQQKRGPFAFIPPGIGEVFLLYLSIC